jgi:hypothetical protein
MHYAGKTNLFPAAFWQMNRKQFKYILRATLRDGIASKLSTCTALARLVPFQRLPDRRIASKSSTRSALASFSFPSGFLAEALQVW